MWQTRARSLIAMVFFVCVFGPHVSFAQENAEEYLDAAKDAYATAMATTGEERGVSFREVQKILDRIIEAYPQSDLAMDILLQRPIEGLDLVEVNTEVRKALAVRASALQSLTDSGFKGKDPLSDKDEIAISSSGGSIVSDAFSNDSGVEPASLPKEGSVVFNGENVLPKFAASSQETEKSLNLDRQAIRDIQARLLVIGHDPNGVDGVVGKGTRNAVKEWQDFEGLAETGFLSEAQLTFLKGQSQEMLDDWLIVRNNAKLYSPPKRPKPTSSKPARSKNSGWYRDSRGMYCKRGNFGSYCQLWKPRALR